MNALDIIQDEIKTCRLCKLSENRNNAVPGEGATEASILFIGEGPGAQEDLQGKPFVGASGKVLKERLESIGMSRKEVYITNIVKCRPPNNRPPKDEEIESCKPYLERQIELIKPKLICILGRTALEVLLNKKPISKERGNFFEHDGKTFFVTYHPAAVLHNPNLRDILDQDFSTMRKWLEKSEKTKRTILDFLTD